MPEYTDTLMIPRPLNEVFAFFAKAENLEHITPEFLRFRIASESNQLEMKEGLLIDYRLRVHGIPMRWRSEITEWNPPHAFTDEQRRGPYRYWVHRHTFREIDEQHTEASDHVRYAHWGGPLVERFIVRPDIERIFSYRKQKIRQWFDRERAAA